MNIRTIRGANLYNRVTPPGFPVVLGRLRPDPKGAQYAVVNTSNPIAPVGQTAHSAERVDAAGQWSGRGWKKPVW